MAPLQSGTGLVQRPHHARLWTGFIQSQLVISRHGCGHMPCRAPLASQLALDMLARSSFWSGPGPDGRHGGLSAAERSSRRASERARHRRRCKPVAHRRDRPRREVEEPTTSRSGIAAATFLTLRLPKRQRSSGS